MEEQTAGVPHVFMVQTQAVQPVLGCPSGLEFLTMMQKIIVKEIDNSCGGCCKGLQFDIFNDREEKQLRANQVIDCCDGAFKMPIASTMDNMGALYVHKNPPSIWECCPFSALCCPDLGLRVEAPRGVVIGYVTIRLDRTCACCKGCKCDECCNGCKCDDCCNGCECACLCCICSYKTTQPRMFVMDPERNIIMTINVDKDNCVWCPSPCADTLYSLRANNGEYIGSGDQIGSVRKLYPGCCASRCPPCCPATDIYELEFPLDLEVKMKAVVMSSVFFMKLLRW